MRNILIKNGKAFIDEEGKILFSLDTNANQSGIEGVTENSYGIHIEGNTTSANVYLKDSKNLNVSAPDVKAIFYSNNAQIKNYGTNVTFENYGSGLKSTNLKSENIKSGVTILGVTGTYAGKIDGVADNGDKVQIHEAYPYSSIDILKDITVNLYSDVTLNRVTNGSTTAENLTPENIKSGVTILGVKGTGDISGMNGVSVIQEAGIGEILVLDENLEQYYIQIGNNSGIGRSILVQGADNKITVGGENTNILVTTGTVNATNLEPQNIKSGVTILGVEGTLESSEKNTMALAMADELTHLTPSDTNGATIIKDYACYGAKALVSVELADTVERIGDSAFRFCTNLTSVNLPNVKHLDAYVFDNCSNLTTVISPNVEIIYSRAFYSCYRITNLSFGNVTSIQQLAFKSCTDCLIYDFSNCLQVPKLANVSAFDGINADAKIKVPSALYNDWIAADNWSSFVDYIVAV